MLLKIKARLPGGEYFDQLCSALLDVFHGQFTLKDKYIFLTYFIGNGYAINYLYNVLSQQYCQMVS